MSLNLMHNTSMVLSMKLSIKQGAKEVFYWKAMVLRCVLGAIALAAAAQVCIYRPGNPVPVTLQSLAVLALSVVLGSHLGMGAVLLYLLGGTCGLPIFAGGSSGHHILLALIPQVICRAFCWLLGWLVMQVGKTPWGYFDRVPPVVQFLQSMTWGWLVHCMASWGCALPIGGLL